MSQPIRWLEFGTLTGQGFVTTAPQSENFPTVLNRRRKIILTTNNMIIEIEIVIGRIKMLTVRISNKTMNSRRFDVYFFFDYKQHDYRN